MADAKAADVSNGGGADADPEVGGQPPSPAASSSSRRASSFKRRTVFVPQEQTLSASRGAFISELFRLRKTILTKVVAQVVVAALIGFVALVALWALCPEDVVTSDDCWITFESSGHVVVGLVIAFLLVFRTDLAYARYYNGKEAIGQVYSALRNLNVAATAFMRVARQDEIGYRNMGSEAAQQLSRDRVEVLRLTNLFYCFIRQSIREQRHGYSDTGPVSDKELLTNDRAGKPKVQTLYKDNAEADYYARIDHNNRPNVVAAHITHIVEHQRRLGNLSERACLDIFHECEAALYALKSCERIVTTPIPYQYLHMLNFVLFCYVFTVPFVFSVDFREFTPFAAAIIALSFYGVNAIGKSMEDPFNWEPPCHDLTMVGWRIYRENTALHEKMDMLEKEEALVGASRLQRAKAAMQMAPALKAAIAAKNEAEAEMAQVQTDGAIDIEADDELHDDDIVPLEKEYGSGPFAFFTEVFAYSDTVTPSILPQLLLAGTLGLFAQGVKLWFCGNEVLLEKDCDITFDSNAHTIVGIAMGFLLVFRVNSAYERFYDGKGAIGMMYNSIRNINVVASTLIRQSVGKELGAEATVLHAAEAEAIAQDKAEILRLTNLYHCFIRHAVREQRVGTAFRGKVTDDDLLAYDFDAAPGSAVTDFMTKEELESRFWHKCSVANRPNVVATLIQTVVERQRRRGNVSERGAFEIYSQSEQVLTAWQGMMRIVTTPIPITYLHMVQYLVFFYVYSAPFVFSASFTYVTPFPSVVLALGFYGINEIGLCLQDPFSWVEPRHDMSAVGNRLTKENLQIHLLMGQEEQALTKSGSSSKLLATMAAAMKQREEAAAAEANAKAAEAEAARAAGRKDAAITKVAAASGRELGLGLFSFVTVIFQMKGTVLPKVGVNVVIAILMGFFANEVKYWWCGDEVPSHQSCDITFSPTAHSIVGGVLGFLLVFRTDIAYYRYYEGKKFVGQIYMAVRNVNVAFNAFMRADVDGEKHFDASTVEAVQEQLTLDHIELRRLSNVLYACIRQGLREQRHGMPDDTTGLTNLNDSDLVKIDTYGLPSMAVLLTDEEKDELAKFDPANRPNVVAAHIQSIVEHHRRMGNVSERGAFDIYHDLELALAAFKQCERIVTTKMPYQYLQMVYFINFFFVFSAPFVFTASYHYITFVPCFILAIAFYGVAEIGRSIDDPFKYCEPCHDLTTLGWRLYNETLQLHDICAAQACRGTVQGYSDMRIEETKNAPRPPTPTQVKYKPDDSYRKVDDPNVKKAPEMPTGTFVFISEVFRLRNTVWLSIWPQVLLAAIVGMGAQLLKKQFCGEGVWETDYIMNHTDCFITFSSQSHAVVGAVLAFMLVVRTNLAYLRYYEAKQGLGDLQNGLRNLNIGVAAFIRPALPSEPNYEAGANVNAVELFQDRAEMLRLSAVLFGFIRHMLREQRIGYVDDPTVGDLTLLTEDKHGRPSLSKLLTVEEAKFYHEHIPFRNRPNYVIAKLNLFAEKYRRLGVLSERGAYDIYHECELILNALQSCERVVTTPVPYPYLHMLNFVMFCFVYSAPFVFTVSFKWTSFFPSMILALGFYGIQVIGTSIERPFDYEEPNHDISGVGWRIWREVVQIHQKGAQGSDVDGSLSSSSLFDIELRDQQPVSTVAVSAEEKSKRRMSVVALQAQAKANEFPRTTFAFFTQLFRRENTVLYKVLPQLVLAAILGFLAQLLKEFGCGDEPVTAASDCYYTFTSLAHSIAGSVIGFLLVFRINLSYDKYYNGKVGLSEVYGSIRNAGINYMVYTNPVSDAPEEKQQVDADKREFVRLCNVLFALIRQNIREHRHGLPDGEKKGDDFLLRTDPHGSPSLSVLLTPEDVKSYLSIDFNNRPNLCMAQMQRLVERSRRKGRISQKQAFDIYHETEMALGMTVPTPLMETLGGFMACENLVTTPVPYQYLHMLNFVLFIYVYTAPLVFTVSFQWLTPLPCVIVALGFYGLAEIGRALDDPFTWEQPNHDLSGISTRIESDLGSILQLTTGAYNKGAQTASRSRRE